MTDTVTNTAAPEIRVNRLIHDIDANKYFVEVKFRQLNGGAGRLHVPRAMMMNAREVMGMLLNLGAVLPSEAKDAVTFVADALRIPPPGRLSVTRVCGWHGESYVTPNKTLGAKAKELQYRAPPEIVDSSFGLMAGNALRWMDGHKAACEASTFLTFALGVGYGAALLDLIGEDEGAIFNFYGFSSGGKSLTARVCMSLTGRALKKEAATYDVSDRGLEELCFAHNDAAVVFDEDARTKGSKVVRRERIRSIAYMVPSGRGKIRSAKASDFPNLTWRTMGISSGEKPLEDGANGRAAGEQLRHIDIAIPAKELGGIFDRLTGTREERVEKAFDLAAEVEKTISQNYGVAVEPYIVVLVAHRDELEIEAKKIVADFVTAVGADKDSWERRFAMKFGIVLAGAIIAAKYDVAPFTTEHARLCVKTAYKVARKSVFTVKEAVESFRTSLETALQDPSLFPRLEKGQALPSKLKATAHGFRRKHAVFGEIVAIDPAKFQGMVGSKPVAGAVFSVLLEKKVAVRGAGGKSHPQLAVEGFDRDGRARWVCLYTSKI